MAGGMIQTHGLLLWGECVGARVFAAVSAELAALFIRTTDGRWPAGPPSPHYKPSRCSGPVCAPLCFPPFSLQCLMLLPSLSAGEHHPDFSFFYCKLLRLNIPRTFLIPCAFSSYLPRMLLDRAHPQQLCRQCRPRGSG